MNKRPYGSVARSIARVGIGKVPPSPRPAPKPKPRKPKPVVTQAPRTHTSTITGTGVNTTSGGTMPGATAPPGGMPAVYTPPPGIKNWGKATAAQVAQAQLAPEYASLYAQQHQYGLMSNEQANVIRHYGTDLAKILGESQKGGGALGADYAAALTMMSLRQFAYNNFLQSQKFADEYATIAAKYPTYVTQELSRRAEEKRKDAALALQQMVAVQTYGLNVAKLKTQTAATNIRLNQAGQRITLSQKTFNLSMQKAKFDIQKWNKQQTDDASVVDLSLSKGRQHYVNQFGQPTGMPGKPPPLYQPKSKGGAGGGGLTPNERASQIAKGSKMASDLKAQDGISAPIIKRPKAYRQIRTYYHLQFPKMKAKQLNQMTEAALVAGGYPKGK